MRSSPVAPEPTGRQGTSSAIRVMRGVIAVVVVGLPLVQAALYAAVGQLAWLSVAGVAGGLLLRGIGGRTPPVVTALLLAPVWQTVLWLAGAPSDFTQIVPWLAFFGAALAWPGPRPWQVDGVWGTATLAWAFGLALVGPLVVARELDFTWQAASWANAAHAVTVAVLAQLVALLLFEWYWAAPTTARRAAWRAVLPGTLTAAGVAIWQQYVDPAVLTTPFWAGLRRSPGTFFDANATGATLALTIPVLASSLVRPSLGSPAAARVLGLGILGSGAAGIVATGSRSALAAFTVIVAVQALMVKGRHWRRAGVAGLAVAAAAAMLVSAPVPDASTGHSLGRLSDTVRQAIAGGPDEVRRIAWDRDGYGPAAMAMIADQPWAGIGPGLFGHLVGGYAQEAIGRRLPADNAQNWWRHQAAELGLPGAVPGFVCSVLALIALLRRRHDAVAPLAGLGLLSLMSPPMAHPIVHVLVGLVVATAVAPTGDSPLAPAPGPTVLPWVLLPGCLALLLVAAASDLRPVRRAARFHDAYNYGLTGLESTAFGTGHWMGRRAAAVLVPEGPVLVVRVVVPEATTAGSGVPVTVAGSGGATCRHDAVDATPYECRLAVDGPAWPWVRIEVGSPGGDAVSAPRALVSASFAP